MIKKFSLVSLITLLALSLSSPTAYSAAKAGSKCSKVGNKSVVGNKTFTCIKSGKKLVWNKGVSTKITTDSNEVLKRDLSPVSSFLNKSECQLKQNYQSTGDVGFGFPRSDLRLTNRGDVKGIMIFVEFNDVKGSDNPLVEGKKFTTKFEEFYKSVSYGKLKFSVDIHPEYIPINRNTIDYGMNEWSKGDRWLYFNDGLKASDPLIDFSKYEFVVFIPPADIKNIIYGPALLSTYPAVLAQTEEKIIYNGVVGASDQRNRENTKWIWLSHEIGHALGMNHQYSGYPHPIWDLMDNVYITYGPELFAWHRFLQGWFSDSNIACINSDLVSNKRALFDVTALSKSSLDLKSVIIRISDREAVVIETRVNSNFDKFPITEEGILVYLIDVSKKNNEPAIRLIMPWKVLELENYQVGTLKPMDSVRTYGLDITNMGRSKGGFYVEIKKA